MPDDNQILIPPSFIALFVPPGRLRPTEPRAHIAERYELCEDFAQMLVETATTKRFELGAHEDDVLERIGRGLQAPGSLLSEAEAGWVLTRLRELLGWNAGRC
ncbi:ATPase with chaperone activity [Piscinibacter defluvii]|uniref:ATPase with chaperone activity n=1 Tax=Piscinibacter defluvii TaxID=1796922 RepID=UPI000FDF0EE7|nr:ATPase with chaperone activity [Piscinibacter defluvii]